MVNLSVRYTMILSTDGSVHHRSELWRGDEVIFSMTGDWELTKDQLIECYERCPISIGRRLIEMSEGDRRETSRNAPRGVTVTPAGPTNLPRRL